MDNLGGSMDYHSLELRVVCIRNESIVRSVTKVRFCNAVSLLKSVLLFAIET